MNAAGGALTVRVAEPGRDDAVVCALMTEYLTWAIGELEHRYAIVEPPADPDEVPASLAHYRTPDGLLLLARDADGRPAGVGALRRLSGGNHDGADGADVIVEVKRMFVAPAYRDQHVGSAILDRLLLEADQTLGARTVRLDTCRFMSDAQRMYRARGFAEREPYAGTEIPPHLQQYWIFFEKQLARR